VSVDHKPRANFSPSSSEFNTRFDQAIARSGVQSAGDNKHYLGMADAMAFCKACGLPNVKALQTALNKAGVVPQLVVDGKLGGRTMQALCDTIAKQRGEDLAANRDVAFAFPTAGSAEDAEAFARMTEILVEHATVAGNRPGEIQEALQAGLTKSIAAAAPEVRQAIAERVATMASTGRTEGQPDDAADAKAILQAVVAPASATIGQMDAGKLVQQMTQPQGMAGEAGTAVRARLQDATVLAAVAGNPEALKQDVVATEVVNAIGTLDADKLLALAKSVGQGADARIKAAITAAVDALADKLQGPGDVGQLASLRETQKAIDPQAKAGPALDKAAVTMLKGASIPQLDGKDEATPPFMTQLTTVFDGTLPETLTKAAAERRNAIKAQGQQVGDEARKELGKAADVNDAFQQIVGKVSDGIRGREDDDINALFRQVGGADKLGNLTTEGSRKVGALVDRLMAEKHWNRLIDEFGGSERKDLLRLLSRLPHDAVSPKAMAEISRHAADRLDKDDAGIKRLQATFGRAFREAPAEDRKVMLNTVKDEHGFAQAVLGDRTNTAALREIVPNGNLAGAYARAFDNDAQRVDLMRRLLDTVADPSESDDNREWAKKALNLAREAFRGPLEDGDLGEVQSHITKVRDGAKVPASTQQWLTEFWQALEHEKRVN
jgi:hypothetical protein